jgi:hypothetical protein
MPRSPNSKTQAVAIHLLSLFMRAMALGVFGAGLLLFDPQIDLASVVTIRQHWLARLIFLLSIGVSFALGATLAEVL